MRESCSYPNGGCQGHQRGPIQQCACPAGAKHPGLSRRAQISTRQEQSTAEIPETEVEACPSRHSSSLAPPPVSLTKQAMDSVPDAPSPTLFHTVRLSAHGRGRGPHSSSLSLPSWWDAHPLRHTLGQTQGQLAEVNNCSVIH